MLLARFVPGYFFFSAGLGFRLREAGVMPCLEFRIWAPGFRVEGFGVQGLQFRVRGLGLGCCPTLLGSSVQYLLRARKRNPKPQTVLVVKLNGL